MEIYPCLPQNFFQLKNKGEIKTLERLIKQRGFAYLLFVEVIERVPCLMEVEDKYKVLNQGEIQKYLD